MAEHRLYLGRVRQDLFCLRHKNSYEYTARPSCKNFNTHYAAAHLPRKKGLAALLYFHLRQKQETGKSFAVLCPICLAAGQSRRRHSPAERLRTKPRGLEQSTFKM
ncbi:hypothetical protein CNY67_10535 [Desulfovibrio sp. G11]|nr:hypothetical protein CNY67_10535 [Desulfovibrio sp. G11]